WHAAMCDEFNALIKNDIWELVPPSPSQNIITGKWLFRHKFGPSGELSRYKARWVVRGFNQRFGVDYDETFSPVIKPATVRIVLSLALSRSWPIHQLDVKNAFLHGHLQETVYASQPSGFQDAARPHYVCKLKKALYGLKQAPRSWYHRFAGFIQSIGFRGCKADTSLFIFSHTTGTAYLLLYVDDIVLTASSSSLLQSLIHQLKTKFAMTAWGIYTSSLVLMFSAPLQDSSFTRPSSYMTYSSVPGCSRVALSIPRSTRRQSYPPPQAQYSRSFLIPVHCGSTTVSHLHAT
ncbi:UNVERIFIED_CONTAM: hypothetical protein HCY01_09385, partial [Limosilactobacillus fermentum]